MFNHNFNGYFIQQNRFNSVNMGNPYNPMSPYQNHWSQYPNTSFQQQTTYQNYPYGGWNYQQASSVLPILGGKGNVKSIFQNPLEPKNTYQNQSSLNNPYVNYNPYPKPNMITKPNGGFGTILNSFKGQDGNFDMNKMMNTAGQMMNAVNQVSAMVKGLGGMFKI